MTMNREPLEKAVAGKFVPVYMTSRSQVIGHFQSEYPTDWRSRAAQAISGTSDKKSRSYKSAMRQFQFDKRTGQERYKSAKQTAATRARYEQIGRKLPPIGQKLPGNQITITVSGKQYEKRGTRDREWTVTMTGAKAYDFASAPTYEEFFEELGYDPDVVESFDGDDSSGVDIVAVA